MSYHEDDAREAALLLRKSRQEALKDLNDKELVEGLDSVQTYLGETLAQHQGECAMFGDSWPGACEEIESAEENLADLKAEIKRRAEAS